ncbi:MAG: hypothetical protein HRU03_02830 [Nanoarchaeales archaeon]|nr:hypothetical protein [Nanoarchaeales archaeon]
MSVSHYFKYFLITQKISILIKTEYMVHFFVDILYMVFSSLVLFLLAEILSSNFSSIINWSRIDFITFFFLLPFVVNLGAAFTAANRLSRHYIKKGNMNTLLSKPGTVFFNYLFMQSRGSQVFYFLIRCLIFLPFVLMYQEFTFLSFLFSILYSLFLALNIMILYLFLDSFTWLFVEAGDFLLNFFNTFENLLASYPGVFFQEMKFGYLLGFIPVYYLATVAVPLFKGVQVDFISSLIYISITNIVLVVVIILNWRYGLKHYSAFG